MSDDIAPDGTVAGYCVLVTDITKRKRDEARLRRLVDSDVAETALETAEDRARDELREHRPLQEATGVLKGL